MVQEVVRCREQPARVLERCAAYHIVEPWDLVRLEGLMHETTPHTPLIVVMHVRRIPAPAGPVMIRRVERCNAWAHRSCIYRAGRSE